MKHVIIIVVGVTFLALVAVGFYCAVEFGRPLYVAMNRDAVELKLAKEEKEHQAVYERQEAALNAHPTAIPPEPSSFFVDPDHFGTEDNWLASSISREIASQCFAAGHSNDPVTPFGARAQVDPQAPSVHVEITGGANGDISLDLKPSFVWDADAYAPLAQQCLSGGRIPPAGAANAEDVLADLHDLTGSTLAQTDVRLSADLQQNPGSWQDHESAALVLCALALRENAGIYTEKRPMLCRATAHLAVAKALRGSQPETWPGLVADAAIRALAGREVDAVAKLDALSARADCPASAKSWLTALRFEATQDWRGPTVTPASSLLTRIVWFHVYTQNVDTMVAARGLEKILPPPPVNNSGPVDPNFTRPDWCRAIMTGRLGLSVENGHRFTENNIPLELAELGEVLKIEGVPFDGHNLATALNDAEGDTVTKGKDGKPHVAIIGPGMFEGASRRHLFLTTEVAYDWLAHLFGSPSDASDFKSQMAALFQGVPQAQILMYRLEGTLTGMDEDAYAEWLKEGRSWKVWEVPRDIEVGFPHHQGVTDFYRNGVPFGTVFEAGTRLELVGAVDETNIQDDFNAMVKSIQKLPLNEQMAAFNKLKKPFDAKEQAAAPKGPTAREQELLKLNPDNYDLATDHLARTGALRDVADRFLDYNMRAYPAIEGLGTDVLDYPAREAVLRRHAGLNPDAYFDLGYILRYEHKNDEAAEMYRKGFAEGYDKVLMSDKIYFLVEYDLAHNQKDEAERVAAAAADVYSHRGLMAQEYLFEQEGKLDEAESRLRDIQERYNDTKEFPFFYARHQDHFPDKYAAALQKFFPNGKERAGLDSFYQPPAGGVVVGANLPPSTGLLKSDVIVSLCGYRVKNTQQFFFISAEVGRQADFECIVWRAGKYVDVKEPMANERMDFNLADYLGSPV